MASRKIQTEIDRTLKKVNEGVELFDEIWDKVQDAPSQAQKEHKEAELKKEIKKLQRLREQLKAWQLSNDIKDKRPINDARKLIEVKMEAFKIVERETKTKAYSKEGLAQTTRPDPADSARAHTTAWVNQCIQSLSDRIAELELETEAPTGNKKKRGQRAESTPEGQMERNKWHSLKLEQILRLIDNGEVEPADVDDIRDDIEEFIDAKGAMDRSEEECLYDPLDLPSLESRGLSPIPASLSKKELAHEAPAKREDKKPVKEEKRKEQPEKKDLSRKGEATPPVQPAMVKTLSAVGPPLPRQPEAKQPAENKPPAKEKASEQPSQQSQKGETLSKLFEMSSRNLPEAWSSEFQALYNPRMPARTPPYFPQVPHPALNSFATFEKFELDTLFFIFYYEPATYRQTLATAELKRRGWAFDAQTKRWSRADATWDWESAWGLRQC